MNKKELWSLGLLAGLVCSGLSSSGLAAGVVISEIMYHPLSEDVRHEYVELVNTGTVDLNLSGWRFSKGIRFTFGNTVIAAGGYLVVTADLEAFSVQYPGVTNAVGNWEGILSNSGEDLDLDDARGARVDSVRYADEGDWAERRRSKVDQQHQGVVWAAAHDGEGHSLELINLAFSNNHGGNWGASADLHGSPGRVNGIATANIPPLVLEVGHFPLVPRPTDRVVVTLRLVDESSTGLSAWLYWRIDSTEPAEFLRAAMFDDGQHEDGSPGDGIYAAEIPPQSNDSIVEFYVVAADAGGLSRTWPVPVREEDSGLSQIANALYQVDEYLDDAQGPADQPLYKIILREVDRAELYAIGHATNGDQRSNAQFNATFISVDGVGAECRYAVGIRNRGHGTRNREPNNYRINFRSDDPWRGATASNINGHYTHLQHLGATLSLASGLEAAQARPAQLRVNNANLGMNSGRMFNSTYVVNEVYDSAFAEHRFPADSSGNLYRVQRDLLPSSFEWRGTNVNAYTNTWFKTTNESEDDWSDLVNLARVLGTNDLYSVATAREVADIEQWLRYFAIMALLNNRETSPNTGYNDDYLLYSGSIDPRFRLLPYDFDTILGQGDSLGSPTNSIFGATGQPVFQRILEEPEFRTVYFQTLRRLLSTTFAPDRFDVLVDQTLSSYVPAQTRENIKLWMAARRNYVWSLLPADLPPDFRVRAEIRGIPRNPTPVDSARLWVDGEGVVQYQASLDGASFGPVQSVSTPLDFSGLAAGSHELRVLGGSEDGIWQHTDQPTVVSWTIAPSWSSVRLNEVLALNKSAAPHEGTFPDFIELFNEGSTAVNLAGLRLSDDSARPDKYQFPAGVSLGAGKYLRLHANDNDGTSGIHLGFSLSAEGEGVYLYDRISAGGALLDEVRFGSQLADQSVGRVGGSGEWQIAVPTPGQENTMLSKAEVTGIRINEWLADGRSVFSDDFIELFNLGDAPVDLGGLYLTDNLTSWMDGHQLSPLTFIGPGACLAFLADGETDKGPRHVGFKLAPEQGEIGLFRPDGRAIDFILYGMQRTDVSEGRQPSGADTVKAFLQPTPGGLNPANGPNVIEETMDLVGLTNAWSFNATEDLSAVAWTDGGFDDSQWPVGQAAFWYDSDPTPALANTTLSLGRTTYYFRTAFDFQGDPSEVALRIHAFVDDGAVVHLNGVPIYRLRMPTSGTVSYSTYASGTVNNATIEGPFPVSSASLRQGRNVLAVDVHQSGSSSGDVAFALRLEAIRYVTNRSEVPLVLNEVLANARTTTNRFGKTVDFIELHNAGADAFDLGGVSLTDDPSNPRRFVLPAGTALAAEGRWVIECDGDSPVSATNAGFGLEKAGGVVQLFDSPARGGALMDSVAYGLQAGDFSIGRVPEGRGEWTLTQPTPGTENLSSALGDPSELRINEWLATDTGGDDWFEIFNPRNQPVALGGIYLSDDPGDRTQFAIAPLSFLGVGAAARVVFVADGDPGNGADHVNFRLNGDGDSLGIYSPAGEMWDSVSFGPQVNGVSEGRFPDGSEVIRTFPTSISRGAANWLPLPGIVVNEVLAHSDPPWEDAVELHNTGNLPVHVGGWYFSNSENDLKRYRISDGSVLPAGGYLVLYEYQFGDSTSSQAFTFNSARGDSAILSAADEAGNITGWRAQVDFGPSANGISFGRHQTTGTDFVALSRPTFGVGTPLNREQFRMGGGAENAAPLAGPVVISEVMFFPPSGDGVSDNVTDEFVELFNAGTIAQPLFDPSAPTNRWQFSGAMDFVFPGNVALAPGELLLVVSFDPLLDLDRLTAFEERYVVPEGTRVFGPWQGRLGNDGESVKLHRPDRPQEAPHPDAGLVPYILVEMVQYGVAHPWPTGALGTGLSLQRSVCKGYGNAPSSWLAALPTAGRRTPGYPTGDGNGDGLPDTWQSKYFGSATAEDAAPDSDPDQDGMSNCDEYVAGTNPTSSESALRISANMGAGGMVMVGFERIADRTYSLQSRASSVSGEWIKWMDFGPVQESTVTFIPVDGMTFASRFYRIVTPAQP